MSCDPDCQLTCADDLINLRVDYLVEGGARISWRIQGITDPLPHVFQLEFSRSGTPGADDWEAVGAEVTNGYYAIDPDKRLYGMTGFLHYRVRLTTPQNDYVSKSVPADCSWDAWGRQQARSVSRLFLTSAKKNRSPRGYLVKRRFYGPACTACLDAQTGEATDPECPICWGTSIEGGYFAPEPCIYAIQQPVTKRERLEETGTANPIVTKATMLNNPVLDSYDMWVNEKTDSRWLLHTIESHTTISGWPVLLTVEMRRLERSHLLYRFPIQEMIDARQ